MAFGTGTHETTGMCVELIEDYVKPGDTAIDIGTGTGILAIAAALAARRMLLATDLDRWRCAWRRRTCASMALRM